MSEADDIQQAAAQREAADLQRTLELARELKHAPPIRVQFGALDAFRVLAIVQFAWRNPQLTPELKDTIERFGRDLQKAIRGHTGPTADEILEMGWNPAYDR